MEGRSISEGEALNDEHAHEDWQNDHSHTAEDWVVVEGRRFKPTAHRHVSDTLELTPSSLLSEAESH